MLAVPLLATAVGCGPEDAGAAASGSAAASPAASNAESAASSAAPSGHPMTGKWRGPRYEDGTRSTMWIEQDGSITLKNSIYTCKGKATPIGDKFRFNVDECVAPLPPGTMELVDGKTMRLKVDGKTEIWKLLDASAGPSPESAPPVAAPGGHPLAGRWRGPRYEDGTVSQLRIHGDGFASLKNGGFTCTGKVTPLGDKFRLNIDQCIVPLPPGTMELVNGGKTIRLRIDGETEIYRLVGPPD